MIFEWDDFGINHVISDQCQTHDCRDMLSVLRRVNPQFKATLFSVPALMTLELLEWAKANKDWIELGVHGWNHESNYECEHWSQEDCLQVITHPVVTQYFVPLFRAPGWQISDGCYTALKEANYVVCDQFYNNERRPHQLPAYVNNNGRFYALSQRVNWEPWAVNAWHGHTWDCVGNGIYETIDTVKDLVSTADSFQFISEVFL